MLPTDVISLVAMHIQSFGLNSKLYGVPIWASIVRISRDAVLKYALSASKSKREAARFLGIKENNFVSLIKRYKTESYFTEVVDKDD